MNKHSTPLRALAFPLRLCVKLLLLMERKLFDFLPLILKRRRGLSFLRASLSLLSRMIGGARQRAGFDMAEAQLHAYLSPLSKLFRRHVSLDGESPLVRLQVLAYGHDVARDRAQVLHQLDNFLELFAKSDHDAALGEHPSPLQVAATRGTFKQGQRLPVIRVGADATIETRDGLCIVIEHVGLGVEHSLERRLVAVEI